jgi:hypothetical protein
MNLEDKYAFYPIELCLTLRELALIINSLRQYLHVYRETPQREIERQRGIDFEQKLEVLYWNKINRLEELNKNQVEEV